MTLGVYFLAGRFWYLYYNDLEQVFASKITWYMGTKIHFFSKNIPSSQAIRLKEQKGLGGRELTVCFAFYESKWTRANKDDNKK